MLRGLGILLETGAGVERRWNAAISGDALPDGPTARTAKMVADLGVR